MQKQGEGIARVKAIASVDRCITFDEGHGCQTRTAAGWRGLGPELLLRGGGPLAGAAPLRGEGPVEATTRGEPSLPPDSLPPDSLLLWAETTTTVGEHQNKLDNDLVALCQRTKSLGQSDTWG